MESPKFRSLFSVTVRPRRLKCGTRVDSGQTYDVYRNQAAAAYLSLYFFIFLSLQFSTLKFFVTLFSGTMRHRKLKIGTRMDSGQMYHVYWNQAAAAYSSLYFFIFLSLQFSTLKYFITLFSGTVRPRRLKLGTAWTVGRCIMFTGIRLLLLIHLIISSFFLLSSFQHWNILSHFSLELWGLEDWNLVPHGQWADVSCLLESGCCCLFISLFLHFSFSPVFNIEIFCHTFLWNCEA